jgi:hypothetical protein
MQYEAQVRQPPVVTVDPSLVAGRAVRGAGPSDAAGCGDDAVRSGPAGGDTVASATSEQLWRAAIRAAMQAAAIAAELRESLRAQDDAAPSTGPVRKAAG